MHIAQQTTNDDENEKKTRNDFQVKHFPIQLKQRREICEKSGRLNWLRGDGSMVDLIQSHKHTMELTQVHKWPLVFLDFFSSPSLCSIFMLRRTYFDLKIIKKSRITCLCLFVCHFFSHTCVVCSYCNEFRINYDVQLTCA